MFLRRYTRTKSGKKHSYFALVESQRTEAGPRQRVVAYLGELTEDEERRWERTAMYHHRQARYRQLPLFDQDEEEKEDVGDAGAPESVRIRLGSAGWTNARSFGDVYVGLWLWRLLKLDRIVARHVRTGKRTVAPALTVAIEVINRLCAPCSKLALAEDWYASTALEDLLGVADGAVTKDRLYRTLDLLRAAKEPIEDDLKEELGALFDLDFDVVLYDLTSSYFEGLAEENTLAARGYSRDKRCDCKQILVALVVTRDGFPLAHEVLAGNTKDDGTVQKMVSMIERRFGQSQRVWVMDRGMITEENLAFLRQEGRRYLLAAKRGQLAHFADELKADRWTDIGEGVDAQLLERDGEAYLLVRSQARRRKERAIRRRQLQKLHRSLRRLCQRVDKGRLKDRDKILTAVGRLAERYPKARRFVKVTVAKVGPPDVSYQWQLAKLQAALRADGVYLLQSNRRDWSEGEFWRTYIQLWAVERAFRTLKSDLLIRPIWHHYSGRTEAHVMICVLAYALWRTLAELAQQAGLKTEVRKLEPRRPARVQPKPRPMSPATILRQLAQLQIGDILLETTNGRQLVLRRVARPNDQQQEILDGLKLQLPQRLNPDRLL